MFGAGTGDTGSCPSVLKFVTDDGSSDYGSSSSLPRRTVIFTSSGSPDRLLPVHRGGLRPRPKQNAHAPCVQAPGA